MIVAAKSGVSEQCGLPAHRLRPADTIAPAGAAPPAVLATLETPPAAGFVLGGHGAAAALVPAAGAAAAGFFFPKIELKLERAAVALDTAVLAVAAVFCAAAEFVAPASAVADDAGLHAGPAWVAPVEENI